MQPGQGELRIFAGGNDQVQLRRQVVEAAAEIIAERGFHAASLMEIASRAGLTTGAIYSNFRSKEDLFLAVVREMAIPLDLGQEASPLWERDDPFWSSGRWMRTIPLRRPCRSH